MDVLAQALQDEHKISWPPTNGVRANENPLVKSLTPTNVNARTTTFKTSTGLCHVHSDKQNIAFGYYLSYATEVATALGIDR
jgi:hypothetical protein